jgi:hypothetical protein
MIIPRFWAEARVQHREKGRQVTVRRFGWSKQDQTEAQAMADTRAVDALRRLLAGEKLERREPKVAYNGAEGVPIREEIVEEHGDWVITRNSYGALCLNTSDVLFADVDFQYAPSFRAGCAACLVAMLVIGWQSWNAGSWKLFFILAALTAVLGPFFYLLGFNLLLRLRGGGSRIATRQIARFASKHPNWLLRIYETPAGLRVLVMHRLFDPDETEVAAFFRALGTDPLYEKMCRRQKCFRARLTAKPWRIGISGHLKPRPGVWPVKPEALPTRRSWLLAYDQAAEGFAACRFVRVLGTNVTHEKARQVQELHDRLCRSDTNLPIA